MKILLGFLLLVLSNSLNAQSGMKKIKFISDYQVDKTYNGNKTSSSHFAYITMNDPKPITDVKAGFNNLPIGSIKIKYREIQTPLIYELKYFGPYNLSDVKNQPWYGIINSETDYNTVILIKNRNKVGDKFYDYVILTAKMDPNNGTLYTFTAYYSNIDNN